MLNFSLYAFYTIILLSFSLLLSGCSTPGVRPPNLSQLPEHYDHIALLLPLHGHYSGPGKAIRDGFLMGYYQEMQEQDKNRHIRIYDTSDGKPITSLYKKAVAEGAEMVIGPLQKDNVARLAHSDDITVPTLALNYLPANTQPPDKLFQFGISPIHEAQQVSEQALQQHLTKAILIVPQAAWGQNIAQAFKQDFQSRDGVIVDELDYTAKTKLRAAIRNLLDITASQQRKQTLEKMIGEQVHYTPRRRQDFDMIFLVARPNLGQQILPLLRYYYAGQIPVYATSMIYHGIADPHLYEDMNGVIFPDIPWIFKTQQTQNVAAKLKTLWPHNYANYLRLYALGLDAHLLTNRLKQLPATPEAGILAHTGKLFIRPGNRIEQQFTWAQFQSGKAVNL
jgi:outer membrane PBP1 activator LpoA protein